MPATRAARHSFTSDGVEIAYIEVSPPEPASAEETAPPRSKPPILLIHGFASNIAMNWEGPGWVTTLTKAGYRVIALDNRGHGASAKLYDQAAYPAPVMAQDARRLLDHLAIPHAHVMGYSMGARISAFLALAAPERVRSLVFGGLGINMVRGMAGTGPIAHALEAASIDDVVNPTARTFRAFAEQTGSDLKALATCIRASRDPLTAERLATLACPVLVAVGSDDVIGGSPQELAALIPGATAFEIADRDHMKAVGDRRYKTAVLAFLDTQA
ncbi:MAG: alpha/beta fold hydrolase [Pseudomonadota bacterium]